MKNYYKILGIKSNATAEEIDAAYEKLLDWQEKSPSSYPEQRRLEIDEAYDVLADPNYRAKYDRELAQSQSPKPKRNKSSDRPQYAGRRDRTTAGRPARPPESDFGKRAWQHMQRRLIGGGTIILIILAIQALSSLDFSGSSFSGSSDNTPTPTSTVTRRPTVTRTPDVAASQTVAYTGTQVALNTPCLGLSIADTFAYAADQTTQVQEIPANTTLTYKRTIDGEWFILTNKSLGEFVLASDVRTTICREGLNQQFVTPTPTPPVILIGQRCRLRNSSGGELAVYREQGRNSGVLGQIPELLVFFAIRQPGGWFRVIGIIAEDVAGGYVPASEIEVIGCITSTVTPAPDSTPPFGG